MDSSTHYHQELKAFLNMFIAENMVRCKEGIVCDEQLMVDLMKLKAKTKKAFQEETPNRVMFIEPKIINH